MLAKLFTLLAVGVCAASGAAAPKCKTLAEIAISTPGFKTLVAAVKAAGLADELSNPNAPKVTVFAPTDDAFKDVDQETLSALLLPENKDDLLEILTYHIVSGAVTSKQLKDGQKVKTQNGGTVTIEIDEDGVQVNDADVVKADITACNGVVHVIDEVLIPANFKLDD